MSDAWEHFLMESEYDRVFLNYLEIIRWIRSTIWNTVVGNFSVIWLLMRIY